MDRKVLAIALTLTLLALVFTSTAWANQQSPDTRPQVATSDNAGGVALFAVPSPDEIRVTALRPVRIPGAVLPPGEYSFRLNDAGTVVAVSKLDGSKFYGNYLIMPAYRGRRDDKVVYTSAAPGGGPDRVISWFFPGALRGHAFLYPKAKPGNVQVAAK